MDKGLITVLIADDDPDDRALAREAFLEAKLGHRLEFVHDGVQVFDYLDAALTESGSAEHPFPDLIVLDLNMPRLDGRETLRRLKASERYRQIPVVVFTTSTSEHDIRESYGHGAHSFISKPATFAGLLDVVQSLGKYGLDDAQRPRLLV